MDLTSRDIELGAEELNGKNPQISGMRFTNIPIPKGAIINSAHIEFTVDATNKNEDPASYIIYSDAEANPATFSSADYDISSRTWSDDSITWEIAEGSWTNVGDIELTPDITSLVETYINNPEWRTGNAMAFYFSGKGVREAESFDGDAPNAARLVIDYVKEEIIYNPELVYQIPDKELVQGWDFTLNVTPFFVDRDSELSFEVFIDNNTTLPEGFSFENNVLTGSYDSIGTFQIEVIARSNGKKESDTFNLRYIAPSDAFTLAIFHNNDGESDLLQDSITVYGNETIGGSISQFKATLDSMRSQATERGYESIMLSSGDNFLAGLEYNASQANGVYYDALALDALDYDAICLGNHDFDFGTTILAELIQSFTDNPAPYLSSNLSFENVPELLILENSGRIAASTIVDKGGEQIGIIGLTTPLLPIISSPGNTIVSDAIVESVQTQVDKLTNKGVNKIILISHLQNYNEDIALASQVYGIDIIIAGGGDELLANDQTLGLPYNTPITDIYPVIAEDAEGNNVYIVTTPGNYRFLGNLLVDFDEEGEVVKVYQSDPVLVYGNNRNQALVTTIEDPIKTYIGDLSVNVIATVEDTLDYLREHLRGAETNGGNLFADAILWQAQKNATSFGVKVPQVALQNSGGLRIESLIEQGDFTEDLTYEIAAFTNIVSVVEDIEPAKFLELIEHGFAQAPTLDGRFPQISGFVVEYFIGEPEGSPGVKSIVLNDGTVLVENGIIAKNAPSITMATIDFTANGGDGYPFDPYTCTTLGTTYQQAFRNFLVDADGLNGVIPAKVYPYNAEPSRIIPIVYEAGDKIILSENFNDCTVPPTDWIVYSISSNADWSCTSYGASGEDGDFSFEMNGYGADDASEDWLITPQLELANDNFMLNFNSMVRYNGPALEIVYSSDYDGISNPYTATWTHLTEAENAVDTNSDSYDFVNSGDISLQGISGTVYFAFKYTSTGIGSGQGARYRIDDVVVSTKTLLYENFNETCINGSYIPENWTIAELGTQGMVMCSSEGYENSADDYSLLCNGYGVGQGEVWTITPKLALGSTDYELTFASKVQYSGPMPTVLYSTDYTGSGDPNIATWTEINDASDAITTSFSISPTIDLSFIEEDAYIAWKYVSEGSSSGQSRIFLLDEVKIAEPAEIITHGTATIAEIQGEGAVSPLENAMVSTTGVVTKRFTDSEPFADAGYISNIKGFYIQDTLDDGNPLTSEGLFIYAPDALVKEGDLVQVSGKVTEYYGLTEINDVSEVIILDSNIVIEPLNISLPVETSFEAYEGMLVTINSLTVTENRNIENYGELRLSANGILTQPTQVVDPNDADPSGITANGNTNTDAVATHLDEIHKKSLILDDARTSSYPKPIPYLDKNGTIVAGTTISNVTGILEYSYSEYRIQPTEMPEFNFAEREAVPSLDGASLKVASFNVLNYFNGDGQGGGFPTSRGASSYDEFVKQREKIVAALIEINADVVGLMEIENDGNEEYSAVKDLVGEINKTLGATVYNFVPTGLVSPATVEPDEITVALIFKTTSVEIIGTFAILNNNFDANFHDDYNRPAVAQTFGDRASGEQFTVVVNHLKSKGSGCDELGDPDDSDGQGNCNVTRTLAAGTLASWLESDPTNTGTKNHLIIGDLNSYAQEDPIDTLRSKGYKNLVEGDYSYVYDGQVGTLDYALANTSLLDHFSDVKIWHINSTEPDYLSYNGDENFYSVDPYRSSDHDPVIVGLHYESGLRISSLSLIDANTGKEIMQLKEGAVIDYNDIETKEMNIVAETAGGEVKKVIFNLSGSEWTYRNDNTEPFTLASNKWSPNVGDYKLTATPYAKKKGKSLTINFSVKYTGSISSFLLVDNDADTIISTIIDGEVFDHKTINALNFNIEATADNTADYVIIKGIKGEYSWISDNNVPFRAFRNYKKWHPLAKEYKFSATPYIQKKGADIKGLESEISFSFENTTEITNFYLVDVESGDTLQVLEDTVYLSTSSNENLNILAETNSISTQKMLFYLSGPMYNYSLDKTAPFNVLGRGNTIRGYSLRSGNYTLEATPYSYENWRGVAGSYLSKKFVVMPDKNTSHLKFDNSINANVPENKFTSSVYPTPFTDALFISINSTKPQTVSIAIYNTIGELVYFSQEKTEKGLNTIKVKDLAALKTGIYYVKIKELSIAYSVMKE